MNTKTKVYLRADGNSQIGLGHVHRLIALSEILREAFTCVFIIRSPLPGVKSIILESVDNIVELNSEDAIKEVDVISELVTNQDIVVLDGYAFSSEYQKKLKSLRCGLICIDDIHQFHFYADVVINTAGGVDPGAYSLESYTHLFTGPKYSLVKKAFRLAAEKEHTSVRKSLLICLGGADPLNHTVTTLRRISSFAFDEVNVVIGEAYAHTDVLESEIKNSPLKVNVLKNINPTALSLIMSQCPVAICSASGIAYEYLTIGGELYILKTVENQIHLYNYLITEGLAFDLKDFRVNSVKVNSARAKQREVFDGNAFKRILKLFHKLDFDLNVTVRRAAESDLMTLFNWANEPEVRKQSHNTKAIPLNEHTSWFRKKMNDPATLLYIFDYKNTPAALVRFDVGLEATISYSIDINFRGRGWGQLVLARAMETFRQNHGHKMNIVGYVKHDNRNSNAVFKSLGFEQSEAKEFPDSYKYEHLGL